MPAQAGHTPRGPAGTIRAFIWSLQGLRAAWLYEASFRLEVVLAAVLIPFALLLDRGAIERLLLIVAVLFVLAMELINSAVETAIDRIGSEHHELSGRAKDLGSAAVLVAIVAAAATWVVVLAQ